MIDNEQTIQNMFKGVKVLKKVTNDHRTRVTKILIRKSFMELLKNKPIQNISIKEICDKSGISRGTFYAHYTDIYDLLNQLENEMLEEFKDSLKSLMNAGRENMNPVEISTEVFKCLRDNADICTVTLGDYGDKSFALKLLNIGREKCMETYLHHFKNSTPKQIELFYAFVSAGCIGLLRK